VADASLKLSVSLLDRIFRHVLPEIEVSPSLVGELGDLPTVPNERFVPAFARLARPILVRCLASNRLDRGCAGRARSPMSQNTVIISAPAWRVPSHVRVSQQVAFAAAQRRARGRNKLIRKPTTLRVILSHGMSGRSSSGSIGSG
jgi:hypothetical protein